MSTRVPSRIMLLRIAKGLRQEDIAAAVGVSPQTVSNWETGRTEPKLKARQFQKLCSMLGVTIDELADILDSTASDRPDGGED